MSMIKRGYSETSRPSVIGSCKKCQKCGYSDKNSDICPKCSEQMISVLTEASNNCKNGICRID